MVAIAMIAIDPVSVPKSLTGILHAEWEEPRSRPVYGITLKTVADAHLS